MKRLLFVLALLLLLPGCATTTRHYAVTADYAFATAVNAVDDALFNACQTHTIPAETCNTSIKPAMINVQTSVKAASLTLRALPDNAQLPKSVPDLLDALHKVQNVLDSLGDLTNPAVSRVVSLLSKAIDEAVKLLYVFTPQTAALCADVPLSEQPSACEHTSPFGPMIALGQTGDN